MLPTGLLFSGTTLNREEGRKNLIIIFLFLRYLVESEKKGSRMCPGGGGTAIYGL